MARAAVSSTRDDALDSDVSELAMLLGRVVHNLKQRGGPPPQELADAFEDTSLGPRHMPVLVALSLAEPLGVSEIADRIGLSVATTSLLVGELSRVGLVDRTEDERDRRRTIVTLGPQYSEALETWTREVVVAPLRTALERLSPRARTDLLGGLRVLAEGSEPEPG